MSLGSIRGVVALLLTATWQSSSRTTSQGNAIKADLYVLSFFGTTSSPTIHLKGTKDFMSTDLLTSIRAGTKKLRSPADDLFSFYFVAQWAAVFNNQEFSGDSSREIPPFLSLIRRRLAQYSDSREAAVASILNNDLEEESHGQFLTQCQPFLQEWHSNLLSTNRLWAKRFKSIAQSPPEKPSETYMTLFEELTTQLVTDTLKIAHKHLSASGALAT
jgi:hypothetical protein